MTYIKKNFFILFLFIYFVVGAFYSLNNGLSFDEFHEQKNWEYNVALVKHILFKVELDAIFNNYGDKYCYSLLKTNHCSKNPFAQIRRRLLPPLPPLYFSGLS